MARLHLVRHGEAATGWTGGADPGLSDTGRRQAEAMAGRLAPIGPLPVLTSPLRRARETAAALEARWNILAVVEPGVGEVPSPSDDPEERRVWLQRALTSTWEDLGPRYRSWRTMVEGLLLGIPHDTVIVTHFVLVNVALGVASGRDSVLVADVAPASVTVVDNDERRLRVVEVGGGDRGEVR